jgi:hypothetical protein
MNFVEGVTVVHLEHFFLVGDRWSKWRSFVYTELLGSYHLSYC